MAIRISMFLLFFQLSLSGLLSQPSDFGKVSTEELLMRNCPLDTSASAIILFDKGEAFTDNSFYTSVKRHVRIKFFKRDAITKWANFVFRIPKEFEISKVRAVSYNLENSQIISTKMESGAIFRQSYNKYIDEIKFPIPNVREGTVIECKYDLNLRSLSLLNWQFQYDIPNLWSKYSIYIPRGMELRHDLDGFYSISEETSSEDGTFRHWAMKNIPAFKEEPFISNENDYLSRLNLFTVKISSQRMGYHAIDSWLSVGAVYNDSFQPQLTKADFLDSISAQINLESDLSKRISQAVNYLKHHLTWNKYFDDFPNKKISDIWKQKLGNSAGLNLTLIALLRKCNVEAYPLLLSTRKNGMIHPFQPKMGEFNNLICLVKGQDKVNLIDITDRNLNKAALPEESINGIGLAVYEKGAEWITVSGMKSKTIISFTGEINDKGVVIGSLNVAKDGLAGAKVRRVIKEKTFQKYVDSLSLVKNWEVTNRKIDNIDNADLPTKEQYEISTEDFFNKDSKIITINPFMLDRIDENPFKSEERIYPVDFNSPFEKTYQVKIKISPNFVIDFLPENKLLLLPENAGKFSYSLAAQGNDITFLSQFMINKAVFTPKEYHTLREFYLQTIMKQAELIVIKRK